MQARTRRTLMHAASTVRHQLDVREIPPRERHARIHELFDALAKGDSFVLVNDHDPKPLLYEFQIERAGQFDWTHLERGPEVWRIQITRRAGEETGRSIHEYLQWDHVRLDTIMERTLGCIRSGDREGARRAFGEFRTGLEHHIRMEEEVLFPAFDELTGFGGAGPTAVMRGEHIEIQGILASLAEVLAAESPSVDVFDEGRSRLVAVLRGHNAKEEEVLYPMSDRGLPPAARDALIRAMQAL
jgi:uncharacterized protein (DUF2249 family)